MNLIQKMSLTVCALAILVVPVSGFAQNTAGTDKQNTLATDRAAKADARAEAVAAAKEEREANLAAKKEDLAAKKEEAEAMREQKKTELFCGRMENNVAQIQNRINNGLQGIQNRYTEHGDKVAERKTEQFEKLATERLAGDERREEYYNTLVARATTEAQKEAVATYEDTVESAVAERRTLVDTALTTFWDASQKAVMAHQEDYTKAYNAFEEEVTTIVATAQEECLGTTVAQNRANNVTQELQGVLKAFRENQTLAQNLRDELKALHVTMQEDIQKATNDYRTDAEEARATLQKALESAV